MYETEDMSWVITVTDSSGDPVDITGYTFYLTVKKYINDSDANAVISKTITNHHDPTAGQTTITVDSADTLGKKGFYVYDIQWLDTNSDRRVILDGKFSIKQVVRDGSS